MEEQQVRYQEHILRQLEEQASSAAANILLAVEETRESLLNQLTTLYTEGLPEQLIQIRENSPLIKGVYAWDALRGFWFPPSTPPSLKELPWTLPEGTREIAHPSPVATIDWKGQSQTSAIINKQFNAKKNLKNLVRSSTLEVTAPRTSPLPMEIESPSAKIQLSTPAPPGSFSLPKGNSNVQEHSTPSPPKTTATQESPPPHDVVSQKTSSTPSKSSLESIRPVDSNQSATQRFMDSVSPYSVKIPFKTIHSGSLWTVPPAPQWYIWAESQTQEVVLLEIDTDLVLKNLQPFIPESHFENEFFELIPESGQEAQSQNSLIQNLISFGALLPHWRLLYGTHLHATSHFPQTMRWAGSILITGVLLFILVVSLHLRQSLFHAFAQTERKSDFIANISHELKSPLTTIQLYTEMLNSEKVRDPSRKSQYLRTILGETKRLDRLLDNLLTQNKIERNQLNIQARPLDIHSLVQSFCEKIKPTLPPSSFLFEYHISEEPLTAYATADSVEQILINLTNNALKYAREGGALTIEAYAGIQGIHISVKDRGKGIPYSFRKQLFTAFEQGEHPQTSSKPGMGLGLSIAYGLAKSMGGDLIYAPRKGGGSLFTLILKPVPHEK